VENWDGKGDEDLGSGLDRDSSSFSAPPMPAYSELGACSVAASGIKFP